MSRRLSRTLNVLLLVAMMLFITCSGFIGVTSCSSRNFEPGIMLTFDDKEIENWYSARDLFNKYHAKATFFITRSYLLTEDELSMMRALQEDGHVFGSHGYDHKNAIEFLKSSSLDDYIKEEITPSIQLMTEKGFEPMGFAYPYGSHTSELDHTLLKYFSILRATVVTTSEVRIKNLNKAYISKNNMSKIIYGVGIDDSYGNTLKEIMEGIDRAKKNGEILVFYSHVIKEKPDHDEKYVTSKSILEEILKYTSAKGLKFYTASEIGNLVE
ncbi:MAG: polysaccharide deacetylase family protein [Clostridiaceae bacterium]|jgi:peptidoglycan/xylan/chitin deacetylase (PgdA/CDA1 family)|nr:polysaccharide deacetylase family protein [Clostridiaceae bacterium]